MLSTCSATWDSYVSAGTIFAQQQLRSRPLFSGEKDKEPGEDRVRLGWAPGSGVKLFESGVVGCSYGVNTVARPTASSKRYLVRSR